MFGLTCYQVLKYYIRKRDDRASVKFLYALLWSAEAINLITAPVNNDRLVKTLDKPDPFSSIRGSLVMMVVAQFLGAMILKGIIVHETWKLGNRSWLFLAVLIVLSGGSRLIARQLPDILLSATLSFLLARQRKNRSRLERVNSISSAFTYVVSIGALPP
ncbi:hypothetical protein OH76DRAFT_964243 [Lentinus brumalis]|uniref:Uncharacterized protein n=1 Tax=Lentinus brumalis TaxID=2498619 RepID=A0A371DPJ0_9APHY|nr:hypothetical protein OH76DRAFT_964243 [Polyporus brumalis]